MPKSPFEKCTNQNELKIKTKELIDNVQKGDRYIVMRYSKPVGVLLGVKDYFKLTGQDLNKKCVFCKEVMQKALKKLKQK